MSTDEARRIRADMLLQREDTERLMKCCLGKAHAYGQTLSLLGLVLMNPKDKDVWEQIGKEMNVPAQVVFGTEKTDKTKWLPECPSQSDIVSVLQDIQRYNNELTRLNILLK